jgi:hypothetical protein
MAPAPPNQLPLRGIQLSLLSLAFALLALSWVLPPALYATALFAWAAFACGMWWAPQGTPGQEVARCMFLTLAPATITAWVGLEWKALREIVAAPAFVVVPPWAALLGSAWAGWFLVLFFFRLRPAVQDEDTIGRWRPSARTLALVAGVFLVILAAMFTRARWPTWRARWTAESVLASPSERAQALRRLAVLERKQWDAYTPLLERSLLDPEPEVALAALEISADGLRYHRPAPDPALWVPLVGHTDADLARRASRCFASPEARAPDALRELEAILLDTERPVVARSRALLALLAFAPKPHALSRGQSLGVSLQFIASSRELGTGAQGYSLGRRWRSSPTQDLTPPPGWRTTDRERGLLTYPQVEALLAWLFEDLRARPALEEDQRGMPRIVLSLSPPE